VGFRDEDAIREHPATPEITAALAIDSIARGF
jgi:hypothetical protein